MNLTTTAMLDGLTAYLTSAVPAVTFSRKYRALDEMENKDFPRVAVLLGGGEQAELDPPNLDEQTEVVLVFNVRDTTSPEDALIALFGQVLTALQAGFDVSGTHYDVPLTGSYQTDRQSAGEYGWLVKKVTIFQRHN